jgi:hypothetical protein
MGYIVDLCGTIMEVPLSFFDFKIVRHDIIGDVHFVNYGELTFSIHNNVWQKVQIDLRDKKILDILK